MKILHLLASPVFSGPAENVANLALAQRSLGHEVSIAIDRKRELLGSEEPAAPRLSALGLLDEGELELSVKSGPVALWRDFGRLRRRRVDVMHSHFSHDHLLARFARPAGCALVRSIHAPRSLRPSLPFADAYTVSTQKEVERLSGRKVIVLPPVLGAEFRPIEDRQGLRRELSIDGEPLIGMASTFQASRRHALAIAALANLKKKRPSARLVLLGDGVLEGELRAQVLQEGLESSIVFAGYQKGPAFVRWLQALDELWVLGLGNDFGGRVAAQARACGVRVVAVDEGALGGLADALVERLEPDAVVEASLGGRRVEREIISAEATARTVLQLYEEIR